MFDWFNPEHCNSPSGTQTNAIKAFRVSVTLKLYVLISLIAYLSGKEQIKI